MAQPAVWDDPEPLAVSSAPVPEYGSGSLADLLPTLAAGMGVPDLTAAIPELTPADRNCVFLIDGLGWEQIKAHRDEAPYLHSLLGSSRGHRAPAHHAATRRPPRPRSPPSAPGCRPAHTACPATPCVIRPPAS